MNFLDIFVRELVRIILKETFKKLGNYIQLIDCIIYSYPHVICSMLLVTNLLISSELHQDTHVQAQEDSPEQGLLVPPAVHLRYTLQPGVWW